jgi:molybdate transport system substrate-binding protein
LQVLIFSNCKLQIIHCRTTIAKQRMLRLCLLKTAVGVVPLFLASLLSAAEIRVFAAASLTDSLKQIAAAYHAQTGIRITFNFAASSFLERQISEGASADIFFSADEARMDGLAKQGLILPETRKSLLSNTLVVVVIAESSLTVVSPADLQRQPFKRIALADPQTVPAGIYARKYFEQARLWPALKSKIVPTDNVRAALSAVESGNVEAGVVYKTDAAISKKVKIAYEIPPNEAPRISYPAAILKSAPNPGLAKSFLAHLTSQPAKSVFRKFGFIVLD